MIKYKNDIPYHFYRGLQPLRRFLIKKNNTINSYI